MLVAAELDKLSRSTVDLLGVVDESERCGSGVVTANASVDSSTDSGRMVSTMIAAVLEMGRRLIVSAPRLRLLRRRPAVLGWVTQSPRHQLCVIE